MKGINAILYVRVSTDEQAKSGTSLEYQEMVLRRYCKVKEYAIKGLFIEDYSAKTFDRPKWKEVKAFIKANKGLVNKIVVLKWDRFSRNTLESLQEIKYLQKLNIEVEACEQPLDMSSPDGKMMLNLYLTLPEIENDKIAARTKDGMYQSRLNGCWVSLPPFGYDRCRIGKNSSLVPNKDSALVIELFELMATGAYSIKDLRRILKHKGFSKSKQNTINILRNVAYLGKIVVAAYKGQPEQIIKGLHEPIIEEEVFEHVQDILQGKRRKHKRCDKTLMYPLKRFLKCPICDRSITGSASLSRAKLKYHYYHCTKKGHQRERVNKIHEAFDNLLNSIHTPQEIIKLHE